MLLRAAPTTVVRSASAHAALTLACLFATGCAAPVLEYEDQFTQARIDNPDGDNSWNPADQNGNGTIDATETYSPQVEFPATHGTYSAPPPPPLRIPNVRFANEGQAFLVITDSSGNIIGNGIDFDDLHTFNIGFDELGIKSLAQMRGLQVLRGLRFTNVRKDKEPPPVEHSFEVSTGVRYLRVRDDCSFIGEGNILGQIWADTSMDNTSIGPQCAAKWSSRGEKWDFETTGSLLVGYHDVQAQQIGAVGEDLVAGNLNRPLGAQPRQLYDEQSGDQFSPLGEFDTSASYQLTRALTFKLGYNVFYAGNLRYAEDSINWQLPDMGLVDALGRDAFQKTVYANIEFLR